MNGAEEMQSALGGMIAAAAMTGMRGLLEQVPPDPS